MSLMLKLSPILLASISLFAASSADVERYVTKGIGANPSVSNLKVQVVDKKKLSAPKGWESYIVKINAHVKRGKQERDITQKEIYFVNGDFITTDIINMKTGSSLKTSVSPSFKAEFYTKEHLIYGKSSAKHKVAIFSDPLCPFCRKFVPSAISYMKKYPNDFAVYYYHFPLAGLHPASVTLTKAAIVAHAQGRKDVELNMYKVEINAQLKDEQKILDAFNKTLNTKVTLKDIHSKSVVDAFKRDMDIAAELMVNGTPTMFFDDKKDNTKAKYKNVKVK